MKRNKNENRTGVRKRISSDFKVSSKEELRKSTVKIDSSNPLESSVDTASLSSAAANNTMDAMSDESSSYVSSEISSVSSRSHESLSFIRAKSLYTLAQEMNALVDEMHDLENNNVGPTTNHQKEGLLISGSVSDDDLDDLQRELANADEAFGGMFVDWDGKSIVVVHAQSEEGITDIPDLPPLSQMDDFQTQSKVVEPHAENHHHHHPSWISLDESKEGTQEKTTKELVREESHDFQPPAHSEQEYHEIHRAPVSLKESTEGLQEESSNGRSGQQTKPDAFRQLEDILAVVQAENRTLRKQVGQLEQIRTKEEEEYDKSMQEVEDKVLTLMKRLQDKQTQYSDAMKQARDERASLEQRIQTKEGQIQQLVKEFQQKSKEEASRRKKLEKALDTVQRDLERVDSVTSDMVQELDDASSYGGSIGNNNNNSPSSHQRSLSQRNIDSWGSYSPNNSSSLVRKQEDSLSDKIPEALTINHVLHMCQSPPKVSRMSNNKSFDAMSPPGDMVNEIKMRNEKAVQVLVELKTKAQQKMNTTTKKQQSSDSIALDYGHAEPALLDANLQHLNGNHLELVSQLDQESDLVNQQLSVHREIIARLENKQKTMLDNSRQRYSCYESELSGLKATYDEQLATFANENESLNQKLANVSTTIESMKSRHKKEITNLKLERQEIEKELLMDKEKKKSDANDVDRFQQENKSLSRQLVQYNQALDLLRSGHEMEIKAHEANQTCLVQELKRLQSKYEFTVGTFHRQKEILMLKLIEKERAISEIELAQENNLKARQEEKERLEDQLQTLDERCTTMKKERAELLQAQKQKFELLSYHMKDLKTMRDIERKVADQRITELKGKLETLQQRSSLSTMPLQEEELLPKTSGGAETAYDTVKSNYSVAAEASDTSRTSCLDPMADEDDKLQDRTVGVIADQKVPGQQSYVGMKRAIAVLLLILVVFAYMRLVQEHVEEMDSLNRELAVLQGEVNEWKIQDAAKDVTNLELQHSLQQANSKSLSDKQEALKLADQLRQLQVKYESLQQEHADHLESYLEETSHEPLPRCFSSPTLAMVASFEEELKDWVPQNVTAEADVLPVDIPLDQDPSCEEDASNIQEEPSSSAPVEEAPVEETRSSQLVNSPATMFELSKAGLEAELFLVDNLELLSQFELLEMQRLSVTSLLNLESLEMFRDHSVALIHNTATKLKNRLLPKHRRLINSEEGVWLEL